MKGLPGKMRKDKQLVNQQAKQQSKNVEFIGLNLLYDRNSLKYVKRNIANNSKEGEKRKKRRPKRKRKGYG